MKTQVTKHPDGEWKTSYSTYKGRLLILKSQTNHGIKIHSIHNDKVEFTIGYSFIIPSRLIEKAKKKIDKLIQYQNV